MHPVLLIVFLPLIAAIIAGLGGRVIGKTASKVLTTGALMIGAVLIAIGSVATLLGQTTLALTAAHVAVLETLVTDYRGQGPLSLPGAVTAGRRCGRLTFGRRGQRGAGE